MSKMKYVYFFGGKKADGNTTMKNLLGGKGIGTEKNQSRLIIIGRLIKHRENII